MAKVLGPSWMSELIAAGLNGLPFSWTPDGTLVFDAAMTPAQIAAVQAAYATHDSTKPVPFVPTPLSRALDTVLATPQTPPTNQELTAIFQAMRNQLG